MRVRLVVDVHQLANGGMCVFLCGREGLVAKKFLDPRTYIPQAVLENRSWGRKALEDGGECFLRANRQRAWKAEGVSGQVLEEIYLSPKDHCALGLGRAKFLGEDGAPLEAGGHQPLFHVEHSVGGKNTPPLNLLRGCLTTGPLPRVADHAASAVAGPWNENFANEYGRAYYC